MYDEIGLLMRALLCLVSQSLLRLTPNLGSIIGALLLRRTPTLRETRRLKVSIRV
jgi:hypothetical protein